MSDRSGRGHIVGGKAPVILVVCGKHRYTCSSITKDGQKWTMTCAQAALVRKTNDGQFYLTSCSKTHNYKVNEASVISQRFKLKMKKNCKEDSVRTCLGSSKCGEARKFGNICTNR